MQRLPPILRRGQDNTACLKIAEGHALLGGGCWLAWKDVGRCCFGRLRVSLLQACPPASPPVYL